MTKFPRKEINRFYLSIVLEHITNEGVTEKAVIDSLYEFGFFDGQKKPARLPKDDLQNLFYRLMFFMHNYEVHHEEGVTIDWEQYLGLVGDLIFQPLQEKQDKDDKVFAQLFLDFIDLYYLGGYPSYAFILLYHFTGSRKKALKLARSFIPGEDLFWASEFIMSLPDINKSLLIS